MEKEEILRTEYIGWVPILSVDAGLSSLRWIRQYKHLGIDHKRTINHMENVEGKPLRSLAVTAKRHYEDSFTSFFRGLKSKFDLVLIGFEIDEGNYEGAIYIWPTDKKKNISLYSALDDLVATAHKQGEVRQQLKILEMENPPDLPDIHIKVTFSLKKNGIVKIRYLKTPNNGSPDAPISEIVANQAFSFIRDVFHKHEFHSPDMPPTRSHKNDENSNVGLKLVNDLISEMQILRESILLRDKFPLYYVGHAASNTKGISQYALALVECCKEEGLIKSHDINVLREDIERLQVATDSLVEGINIETAMQRTIRTDTRSVFLFILAFFSAVAIFMRPTIVNMVTQARVVSGGDSIIAESIAKIFAKDTNILLLVVVIYVAYRYVVFTHQQYVAYRTRGTLEELRLSMLRNVTRIALSASKPFDLILFTLGLIGLLVMAYMIVNI